jgi:hypothetical protein
MVDIDDKPFSTAVIGVVILATCYVAGWPDWASLVLPLLVTVTFWFAFRSPAPPTNQPTMTRGWPPVRPTEPIAVQSDTIGLAHHQRALGIMLHQRGLDTTTASGKATFQVMGVFAEFERAMIRERVKAGLERGRVQGKRLRPPPSAQRPMRDPQSAEEGRHRRSPDRDHARVGTDTVAQILCRPLASCPGLPLSIKMAPQRLRGR